MKEKLKDSFENCISIIKNKKELIFSNKNYIIIKILLLFGFVFNKNIFLLLVNVGYFFVYKKIQKNIIVEKISNIFTVYFAISLSLINFFIFNIKNNFFIFYFLLLLLLTEILILIFVKILKKNKFFIFLFLGLFFIIMSLLFSVFFKQKALIFVSCNLLILMNIILVNLLYKKLKIKTLLNSENEYTYYLKNFTQLTFSAFIILIFITFKLLKL